MNIIIVFSSKVYKLTPKFPDNILLIFGFIAVSKGLQMISENDQNETLELENFEKLK